MLHQVNLRSTHGTRSVNEHSRIVLWAVLTLAIVQQLHDGCNDVQRVLLGLRAHRSDHIAAVDGRCVCPIVQKGLREQHNINIAKSQFWENTASGPSNVLSRYGGAVFVDQSKTVTVSESQFCHNTAKSTAKSSVTANGGALYLQKTNSLTYF